MIPKQIALFLVLGVVMISQATEKETMEPPQDEIVLGGGCFWCLEALYEQVQGVKEVISGYAGGSFENPSYEQVCSGQTGHAEVVRIVFDEKKVSLRLLLTFFFHIHDPTTLNRQGADIGTQYRSVIFYRNLRQKQLAEEVLKELQAQQLWGANLFVTQIEPLKKFYAAEAYHQDFFQKNPTQGYCQLIIVPKLSRFRQQFPQWLRALP